MEYKSLANLDAQSVLTLLEPRLARMARRFAKARPMLFTFDDALQHLRYGVLLGLKRFRPERSSTEDQALGFLVSTAKFYIMSATETDAYIKCPSHMQAERNQAYRLRALDPERRWEHDILFAGFPTLDCDEIERHQQALHQDKSEDSILSGIAVRQALCLLPPPKADAVKLVDLLSLRPKEAAQALGISTQLLRSRLRAGRKELKVLLTSATR